MFRDINEVKTKAIKELKFLIKNNNEKVVEFINEKGFLAAESRGEVKIYTDKEKKPQSSIHLLYCELYNQDGRENNKSAKDFVKNNTLKDLLEQAKIEIEKDKLKIQRSESTKHLLIELQDSINNYFNSLTIEVKNVRVSFNDTKLEYEIFFSTSIGNDSYLIYFKIDEDNNFIYDDRYKEEKYKFKTIKEIMDHFISEISQSVNKVTEFLNKYSIIENNFKSNIGKKILFQKGDSFYSAIIDNRHIMLCKIDRKKEKALYCYEYLKQFIDSFIRDNTDRIFIISEDTDLSVKNLRKIVKGSDYIDINIDNN